jgi:hypothetical protein
MKPPGRLIRHYRDKTIMIKRQPIPPDLRDELLFQSGRRCCICYGLKGDMSITLYGQIAHLNRNPSDNRFDNLAYLCLDHHEQYASSTQGQNLTIGEVKRYRQSLYDEISRMRNRGAWPLGMEMPYLATAQPVEMEDATTALQLSDSDAASVNVLITYKTTLPDDMSITQQKVKWLHIDATLSPAFRLRIQVRAWNEDDVNGLMHFLRGSGGGYNLHGPRPRCDDRHTGDYFHVWKEGGERKLTISTFTATNACFSIHARFSDEVARALADYLEKVGFTR